MATKVRADVGEVTVLVNNAGIMPTHPLLKHTPQEINKIFDINVLAHFWVRVGESPNPPSNARTAGNAHSRRIQGAFKAHSAAPSAL